LYFKVLYNPHTFAAPYQLLQNGFYRISGLPLLASERPAVAADHFFGWAVITLIFSSQPEGDQEIRDIITGCAAVGSLVLVPILRVQLAKPLEYPTRNGRFWRTMGTVTLVVVLTVAGLALITGGLGLLAVVFGGWAYLPAAWLATAILYADWLFRPDDTWWPLDDDLPTTDPLAETTASAEAD
jgi:hypothetical protein